MLKKQQLVTLILDDTKIIFHRPQIYATRKYKVKCQIHVGGSDFQQKLSRLATT